MKIHLSIKLKLALVVVVTMVVFLVAGILSFRSLNQLSNASDKVSNAQKVQAAVLETEVSVMNLLARRDHLTRETIEGYRKQVTNVLQNRLGTLNRSAEAFGDTDLSAGVAELIGVLRRLRTELNQWIEIKERLGWLSGGGTLGKLEKDARALQEELKVFSMLDRDYQRVRRAERDYFENAATAKTQSVYALTKQLFVTLQEMGIEDQYKSAIDRYNAAFRAAAADGVALSEREAALTEAVPQLQETVNRVTTLLNNEILPSVVESAEAADQTARTTILGSSIVGGIVLIAMLYWIGRGILSGLRQTSTLMQAVAEGDLTRQLSYQSNDEFGLLAKAANSMVENLNGLVAASIQASSELAEMSEQLSNETGKLLDSNQRIALQMQENAAASEQMNATSNEVAERTDDVNRAAQKTSGAASESADIMRRTDSAIKDISNVVETTAGNIHTLSESTTKIGMIVGVIDDLADQTNLLALNAAIEAARAGEAGRGFAVVADEVKKLAEKTVAATGEITQIIETIQSQSERVVGDIEQGQQAVEVGTELGAQALTAIAEIEGQTDKVSDRTAHIATAMEQMRATIAEISRNIETVAHEVQRDEEAVQNLASAAQRVASKAADLKAVGERFSI
ncbi:MAG: hypothetical protein Kow006_24800 [Gammaproteobacteria bacterium]